MTAKDDMNKMLGKVLGINQKRYTWKPKEDITAYELALCMSVLCGNLPFVENIVNMLPDNARRHFEEYELK